MSNAVMNGQDLTGLQKAAILMMSLGHQTAATIMRHLEPKEVQRLGLAMSTIENIEKVKMQEALEQFILTVEDQTGIGVDKDSYVRDVLVNALGEENAQGVIERILLGAHSQGLESLKWMDAHSIFDLIRFEHPQIQSIVISYLDADQAAKVLEYFDEDLRLDLMLRVASLEKIQPNALEELNDIMEKRFKESSGGQARSMGGLKSAANIMNYFDSSIEAELMEKIKTRNEEMGLAIEELMFVFENLLDFSDRDVQVLLREVSSESLLLALKGADKDLKEKIFNNMSKRAAEMMKDDLEAKGPVKLKEVEGAQKEILAVAKKLADAGEISLGRGAEEMI